jgi:hypothetical protein
MKIKAINGLLSRNGGRGLINILLKYMKGVRPRTTKSVVSQVASFTFFVADRVKYSGMRGAVLYLKACQVLLQQSVGGYRVLDISELNVRPKRTNSGLPRIIPSHVRKLILVDRHIPSIKLWMTLFGLFRILEFPGKLKLSTITQSGVNLERFSPKWIYFLSNFFKPWLFAKVKIPKIGKPILFPILKSGPTSIEGHVNSSINSLMASARL